MEFGLRLIIMHIVMFITLYRLSMHFFVSADYSLNFQEFGELVTGHVHCDVHCVL